MANNPGKTSVSYGLCALKHAPPIGTATGAVAIGAAVGIAVLLTPPLLGFTAAGVAAGSLAAAIQSVFYGGSVAAGSSFAIMQSIGATGTIVPAVIAAVGAGGAAAAAGGGEENGPGEDEGSGDGADGTNGA